MEFLYHELYHNPVYRWLISVGVFFVSWAALSIVKRIIVSRFGAYAKSTATDIDDFFVDLIAHTRQLFLVIAAFIIASMALTLPEGAKGMLGRILVVAALLQGAFWGSHLIEFLINRAIRKRQLAGATPEMEASLKTSMNAVRMTARFVLYVILLLLILDNLGIDVTALIAGLGVGGIAVALAVQNILGDLFASLSIVLDKPFVLGDFIIVGSEMGTVERIGLKTTRIKSLTGEQIVFSNTDLLQSRVRNYKRMAERRVLFRFGVVYQTPLEKLKLIPAIVKQLIESQPCTRFDRAHFQKFGDSSLDFEVVYYVLSADYNLYAGIEHQINLGLYERLTAEGISFAYPTRTLFIEQMPGNGTAAGERPRPEESSAART